MIDIILFYNLMKAIPATMRLVMQIRNNYDKSVFNGDIGYVTAVDEADRSLQVTFDDRRVEYDVTELDELVLAYAITIHKSQGSEFPHRHHSGDDEALRDAAAQPDIYRYHAREEDLCAGGHGQGVGLCGEKQSRV